MADEPQQTEQSYDSDLFNDVKSAMTEVGSKTAEPAVEPSPAPEPAPAEAAPTEPKAPDGRPRDEQGRFTEKPAAEPKPATAAPVTVAPTATPAAPTAKPIAGPPQGFSPKAMVKWDLLPEAIRNEIAAHFDPALGNLKPFIERARAQGQRLDQVMSSYVGIEDLIRNNPMQGFSQVAANIGMAPQQMGQFFAQLAQAHGYAPQAQTNGQTYPPPTDPTAAQQPEQPDLSQLLAPVLQPVWQEVQQLKEAQRQQAEAERRQRLGSAQSVIEKFRQDPKHRYYDNVENEVGSILESHVIPPTGNYEADLAAAYELACSKHPEIKEILREEDYRTRREAEDKAAREAADKARSASRSVTGSPSSGASNPAQKRDPRVSYDDDLHNDVVAAMRESMGRA